MRNGPRRGALPARALVTALVVLSVSACGGGTDPTSLPKPAPSIAATPENVGVEVTGLPDGDDFTVTDTSVGVENGANLDFVSPVFTVEPSGQLSQPVRVTVELDNALPDDRPGRGGDPSL